MDRNTKPENGRNYAGDCLFQATGVGPDGDSNKALHNLYNRLRAAYEATSGIAKLPKVQRQWALITLTETLHRGEQPELNKYIRKENDLDKVLVLNGL